MSQESVAPKTAATKPQVLDAVAQFTRSLTDPRFVHKVAASVLAAVAYDVVLDSFRQSIPTQVGIILVVRAMEHHH